MMSVLVGFVLGGAFGVVVMAIFSESPSLSEFECWLEKNYEWGKVLDLQDRFDAAIDLAADFRREDFDDF